MGGEWAPVQHPSNYGVAKDRYNRCPFEPVVAGGLRLEIQSREKWAGGIHEVKIEE